MANKEHKDSVCRECAARMGYVPQDKCVGVWMGACDWCGEHKPLTSLSNDWDPPPGVAKAVTKWKPVPVAKAKKPAVPKRNALAELAENLEHDNFFGCDHYDREVWVGKAQRIIAELAKVECVTDRDGNKLYLHGSSFAFIKKCFAIAEE